jgi:hypothetical protein
MTNETMNPARRSPGRRARSVARALTGDTAGFLALLTPMAALMLMGLVTALLRDLEQDLRVLIVVACGLPFAALAWLIVWAIKNPLGQAEATRGRAQIDR